MPHELKFRQLTVYGRCDATTAACARHLSLDVSADNVRKNFRNFQLKIFHWKTATQSTRQRSELDERKKSAANRVRSVKLVSGHSTRRNRVINNFYYFFKWSFCCFGMAHVPWAAMGGGCAGITFLFCRSRRCQYGVDWVESTWECASTTGVMLAIGIALKPQRILIAQRQRPVEIQSSANESYFMRSLKSNRQKYLVHLAFVDAKINCFDRS